MLLLQVLQKGVVVMDEMVYNTLSRYYHTLCNTGYVPYNEVTKVLVLAFYWDILMNNYRCSLSRDDYSLIERALHCLYGSTCLIPYPDYLKMNKLKVGDMSELACRVKALEDAKVLKAIHNLDSIEVTEEDDVILTMEDEE